VEPLTWCSCCVRVLFALSVFSICVCTVFLLYSVEGITFFWYLCFLLILLRLVMQRIRWARLQFEMLDRDLVAHFARPLMRRCGLEELEENLVGRGSPLFQWWFLAACGMAQLCFKAFRSIVFKYYIEWNCLLDAPRFNFTLQVLDRNLGNITANATTGKVTTFEMTTMTPPELRQALWIPLWLRGLAMAAPALGLAALVIFAVHFCNFVVGWKKERTSAGEDADDIHFIGAMVWVRDLNGAWRKGWVRGMDPSDDDRFYEVVVDNEQIWYARKDVFSTKTGEGNPWKADPQDELTCLVVLMPVAFLAMATGSLMGIIEVMTGDGLDSGVVWTNFERPKMAIATADLELAAFTQYLVVIAFGILCTHFFGFSHLTKEVIRREVDCRKQLQELQLDRQETAGGQLAPTNSVQEEERKKLKEFQLELNECDKEHAQALSWVGLLGVWGYVLVGSVRCLIDLTVLISDTFFKEEDNLKVTQYQTSIMTLLKPVLTFSMILCIVNMFVVLQMKELKATTAFGPRASLKFIACRVLLILVDAQPQALHMLTPDGHIGSQFSGLALSIYQAKLLNVCLLIVECCLLILFNSIFWTSSVRRRIRKEAKHEPHAQAERCVDALVSAARAPVAVLAGLAPQLLMGLTLFWATRQGGCERDPPGSVHCRVVDDEPFFPLRMFDIAVKIFGNFLCLPLLCCRICILGWKPVFLRETHGSRFKWVPKGWVLGPVIWACMFFLRLISFLQVRPFWDYFSDDIFLLVSMVVMLQMELALGHLAAKHRHDGSGRGGWALVAASWLLLLMINWEAYDKSFYYHTAEASWRAFWCGIICFFPWMIWWLVLVVRAEMPLLSTDGGSTEPLL